MLCSVLNFSILFSFYIKHTFCKYQTIYKNSIKGKSCFQWGFELFKKKLIKKGMEQSKNKEWKKQQRYVALLDNFRSSHQRCSLRKGVLNAGLFDEVFLSRPWNFYFERKVSKYFRKRNVCREILLSLFTQSSFIHTILITFRS